MKICFLDDSLPFDGLSPDQRPLGGFQRAIAGLASALARRRHDVAVINNAEDERWVDGVHWLPFGETLKTSYDLLIACGKPSLLDGQGGRAVTDRRVLWSVADPATLLAEDNAQALRERKAELMFVSTLQAGRYQGRQTARVVLPGVSAIYRPCDDQDAAPPPVAIVTAHPDHNLRALIELWLETIPSAVPGAELHIYSALLSRPQRAAGPVPDAYRALYDFITQNEPSGLRIKAPLTDRGMAEAYQTARVHLHPSHADDFGVWTLYDSQACGLPAVARMIGGTLDCVANGVSGYLVPDDAAVINVAQQILTDDALFRRMSNAAAEVSRRRTWDAVALEVERQWGSAVEAPAAAVAAVAAASAVEQALAEDDDLNHPDNTFPPESDQPESDQPGNDQQDDNDESDSSEAKS